MSLKKTGLLAASLLVAAGAQAHVTLVSAPEAAPGSYYKVVLRVPHGCDGADTTQLRVRVPEGMVGVRPQAKPGWKLALTEGDYAQPHQLHGSTLEQGVREISWSGQLPDAWFDEFAFMGYLASDLEAGQTLDFPVLQQCGDETVRWIDTSGDADAEHPAPVLQLRKPQ